MGTKKSASIPRFVQKLENYCIKKIAAGQHSAAVTDQGELMLFGTCLFGEFLFPQKIHNLRIRVADVDIGNQFGHCIDESG